MHHAVKLAERDLYVPVSFWGPLVSLVAPKPKGMAPGFAQALVTFKQYSETIKGDLGDSVRNCHKVLERFLTLAESLVREESGEHSGRLGRLRDLPFGEETLQQQIFQVRDVDVTSINGGQVGSILTQYERFHVVLQFMEEKVAQGGLGPLQGSFNNMLFILNQACDTLEDALLSAPVGRTAKLGEVPDTNFVFIQDSEPSDAYPDGTICQIVQQGFAWEGKELVEAVAVVARGQ